MNCCGSFLKYIIYLFNICTLVCGILLIILGSLMLGKLVDVAGLNDMTNTDTIPILIIILGSIITVISFFGCCGAIRENICLTYMYSICMFILFCLQLALCIWIFVKRSNLLDTMGRAVDKAWEENDSAHGYPMDALQIAFKCCGLNSYQDYAGEVPKSCCGYKKASSPVCEESVYMYKPGCKDEFLDFWKVNMNIISYGSVVVAIIELVAFTFSCCLISSIRKSRI